MNYRCRGAVYIFENREAQRVKVGLSISSVKGRLDDVNDMWLERKVTCQVCGSRNVNLMGLVPQHIGRNMVCPGGDKLPLERDVSFAEEYLARLRKLDGQVDTRIINTLSRRIEKFRDYEVPVGTWEFRLSFRTDHADQVEKRAHRILEDYLDKQAPFGEVFCCSVEEAKNAIESALDQLGLSHGVQAETQLYACCN